MKSLSEMPKTEWFSFSAVATPWDRDADRNLVITKAAGDLLRGTRSIGLPPSWNSANTLIQGFQKANQLQSQMEDNLMRSDESVTLVKRESKWGTVNPVKIRWRPPTCGL